MYYVKNQRNGQEIYDATTNLAIEYFLLNEKKLDEPILLFYVNEKCDLSSVKTKIPSKKSIKMV